MKIKKVSASEQVCEAIQDQISAGVWKVGDKLPSESDLAAKFGVNRLTVRMALQKLNALGIVETRTGSGTFVIEFDFESYLKTASRFYEQSGMMQNVQEFRIHIEIECALSLIHICWCIMADYIYQITADSGCDLSLEKCAERGVMPYKMPFTMDGKPMTDGMTEESFREFYDLMRAGGIARTCLLYTSRCV